MKKLLELYLLFLKIGCVNFGGGLAMYPLLVYEFVEKRGWITDTELVDFYAVGRCTPGIVAINVSTFIGNKRGGPLGGIVATLGFVTAPLLILMLIATFLRRASSMPIVKNAFAGVRVCVCVLVVNALLQMWRKSIFDITTFAFFAVAFAICLGSRYLPISVSPPMVIVAALICGILLRRNAGEDK